MSLAQDPGGLEGVRQRAKPHHSCIPVLADGTCSLLSATSPTSHVKKKSIIWQLAAQALEVDPLGSNPGLVALPVSQ